MFLRTLRAAAVRRGRKGLSDGATPEVSPEGVRERVQAGGEEGCWVCLRNKVEARVAGKSREQSTRQKRKWARQPQQGRPGKPRFLL